MKHHVTFVLSRGKILSLLSCVLLGLSGCSSVLIKSASTDYAKSIEAATTAWKINSQYITNTRTDLQMLLIAHDRRCAIDYMPIWLRPGPALTPLLSQWPELREVQSCKNIIQHEKLQDTKLSFCYYQPSGSELEKQPDLIMQAEASCLNKARQFFTFPTKSARISSPAEITKVSDKALATINAHVFGSPFVNTPNAQAALIIVADYLSILDRIADIQESKEKTVDQTVKKSLTDQVKTLNDHIENARKNLKLIVRTDIGNDAGFKKGEGALSALATLVSTLSDIHDDDITADKLAKFATDNVTEIDAAFDDLAILAESDTAYAQALSGYGAYVNRLQSAMDFNKNTTTERERYLILKSLYTADSQNDNTALNVDISALFRQAKSSHAALVQLIQNPTSEQRKQARAQAFDNFKSLALNLAGLINSLRP